MISRWVLITIILILTLFFTSCQSNATSEIKDSLVFINYEDKPGHGSGFFITEVKEVCTILTAAHVVKKSKNLLLTYNGEIIAKNPNIIKFPNDVDLALINFIPKKFKHCPYKSLLLGNSDKIKKGNEITVHGYPRRKNSNKPVLQSPSGKVTAIENIGEGYEISYDARTFRGMSGGPVTNINRKVIGVHGKADTDTPENSFNWAIPIDTYKTYQKKLNVDIDNFYRKQSNLGTHREVTFNWWNRWRVLIIIILDIFLFILLIWFWNFLDPYLY